MSGQSREFGESRKNPRAWVLRTLPCIDGEGLFCHEAWAGIADRLGLSERQAQILRHMLADQSDEEIALELGLSRDTIHTHLQRLREKFHAHSRLQLAIPIFGACLVWHLESPPPRDCPLRRRLDAF